MNPSEPRSNFAGREAQPEHRADALFGNLPSDSREVNLLALGCARVMGDPEVAHCYYRTARLAGAEEADLQNLTALVSQVTEADLSPLAIETVWQAPDDGLIPQGLC